MMATRRITANVNDLVAWWSTGGEGPYPPGWTPDTAQKVLDELDREASYHSFEAFCRRMAPIAEPKYRTSPMVWGRHMTLICRELEALFAEIDRRRAIRNAILAESATNEEAEARIAEAFAGLPLLRLVILVPPRNSKSTIVGKLLLPWRWLHRPEEQFLTLTNNDTLIARDGSAVRDVVTSAEYLAMQARLVRKGVLQQGKGVPKGQAFALRGDTHAKEKFSNQLGGGREGHVLGGGYVGVDSDVTIIDDPHDIDDGMNETKSPASKLRNMMEIRSSYRDKVQDRLNDPMLGAVVLIMQRVHPKDLADYMIEQGAYVVCLPGPYEPNHPHRYRPGMGLVADGQDWRSEPGEPLNPIRFPREYLEAKEKESPFGFATTQRMRPTAQEGTKFKRAWFTRPDRRYDEDPHEIARRADEVVISVDAASTTGDRSDFTSMGVWARLGARRALLDRRHFKGEIGALVTAFDDLCAEWPEAMLKLIEVKSAGIQLYQQRKDVIPGCVPVNPKGDKETRASYASAVYEAGNVWLPSETVSARYGGGDPGWLLDYIENMVAFGAGGIHDDDVDMTSQVMERWASGISPWLNPELKSHLADVRPAHAIGDHVLRWERRDQVLDRLRPPTVGPLRQTTDPIIRIFVGLVPGWCTGRPGMEATAVLCDEHGRMVSLVETLTGGIETFVESLATELNYWTSEPTIRYAELPSMPATQMVVALSRRGLRVGTRPAVMGQPYRYVGEHRSGFVGDKPQLTALWAAFLGSLSEGKASVRDGMTLSRVETIVEDSGLPKMPDGTAIGGRPLAFLLAIEAAAQYRASVRPEEEARRGIRAAEVVAGMGVVR